MEQLEELGTIHRRFLQLSLKEPYCRRALIEDVFLHAYSREKLRSAAWTAIRRAGRSFELRNDVIQEATLGVLQAFRYRAPAYKDQGAECFGRWLWLLWYRACKRAIARLETEPVASVDAILAAHCVSQSEMTIGIQSSSQHAWQEVLFLISRIDDAAVRLVLSDWAAGFTGAETSRLRDIPQYTVSRLRQCGVQHLRNQLRIDDCLP